MPLPSELLCQPLGCTFEFVKIYFYFICVCVLPVCLSVYHVCAWCLQGPESARSLGMEGCSYMLSWATMWVLGTKSRSSVRQQVLLTTEPSLQHHTAHLKNFCCNINQKKNDIITCFPGVFCLELVGLRTGSDLSTGVDACAGQPRSSLIPYMG